MDRQNLLNHPWMERAKPVLVFVLRALLILGLAALPLVLWSRMMYYNFVVYDESPLSVQIANEMTAVWVIGKPLCCLLGKYMLSGLRRQYVSGKVYRVCCSVMNWLLNVALINACLCIVLGLGALVIEPLTH